MTPWYAALCIIRVGPRFREVNVAVPPGIDQRKRAAVAAKVTLLASATSRKEKP